jgi:heat shock protein HtpX
MGESKSTATVKGPSLAGRYAAAVALAIGFYVLAIGLGGGLLAVPVLMIVSGTFNLWAFVTCLVLGASILIAAFPRRHRFEAPGVRLEASSQPRLVALVEEEARAMGEDPPDEIYATMEVNAAVTQVGRRRRVMIVGLPLMHVVSERGFRGVVAHELGHYAGGDTRLGGWIYRTRETIGRTVVALSDGDEDESWSQRAVRLPFIWYGNAFLRITNAISRRQEFAADACAARSAGRDAYAEALRRIHAFAPLFDAYWQEDVVPVLRGGKRPPMAEGFALVAGQESIRKSATEYL